MEYATFVESVRTDGSRLADAAEGDRTAPVRSCPGWSVRDLVAHVAQVYEHKIQCTRLGHAPDPWPPDQTVGFWARRMAHETAVHRVDAELAHGASTPVDAALATDGVDEILHLMLEGDWSDDADDTMTGQRIDISTGGRTWQVVLDREAVSVTAGGGEADARLTGDPSDVLLWLWGRVPDDRVEQAGDAETHSLMRTRLVMATQ